MHTFTTIRNALRATWPEQSDKVRTLAARYYIGAESRETLEALAQPQACNGNQLLPALLTLEQVKLIIQNR